MCVELGLSHYGKYIEVFESRVLQIFKPKKEEPIKEKEKYIIRRFMACTYRKILFHPSNGSTAQIGS
jgi:hypothetical protein